MFYRKRVGLLVQKGMIMVRKSSENSLFGES